MTITSVAIAGVIVVDSQEAPINNTMQTNNNVAKGGCVSTNITVVSIVRTRVGPAGD